MTYTGFRFTGRNASTARPADDAQVVSGNTWARNRSAVGADDGTEIDATTMNRIKAALEALSALGCTSANGDSQLADSVAAYVATQLGALGISSITGLATALAAKEAAANKGQANGYAPLDGTSKIASAYLPSYVDDVIEAANLTVIQALTGETGKIYVALDTGKTYRWSGSAYVQIAASDVNSVAGLVGVITASALKTALAIASGDVSGLGSLATASSVSASQISDASANGRSLIAAADYAAMRTLLTLVPGTGANKLLQLDGAAKIPAVDGSQLTNLPPGATAVLGQCQFGYTNATTLTLSRLAGTYLFINGSNQSVPSAGVTLSNSGLSATTFYYVYAWMNSGTMTLEASATAPAIDSTYGHRIKTGDATRALVGMCRTNGSSQFVDTAAQRFVRSWHNDRGVALTGTAVSGSATTATSAADSGARTEWLSWANEVYEVSAVGNFNNSSPGSVVGVGIGLDSASVISSPTVGFQCPASSNSYQAPFHTRLAGQGLTEGYHYASGLFYVSGATGTLASLQLIGHTRGR